MASGSLLRTAIRSIAPGLVWSWAYALEKLYPGKIPWDLNRFLIGNHEVITAGKADLDPRATVQKMEDSLAPFLSRREKFLLYK